jgi:hypothetical protein
MNTTPAVGATVDSKRVTTTARAVKEPKPPITIIEACQDPEIFGARFFAPTRRFSLASSLPAVGKSQFRKGTVRND